MRHRFGPNLHCIAFCLTLLTAGAAPAALAQEDGPKPAKIFTDDRVIAARVEGPWKTIMRKKEADETWEGVFCFS